MFNLDRNQQTEQSAKTTRSKRKYQDLQQDTTRQTEEETSEEEVIKYSRKKQPSSDENFRCNVCQKAFKLVQ